MNLRNQGYYLLLLIITTCCVAVPLSVQSADQPESQCVVCHTNVKGLIRLGWEIEKIRPKAGASAETSGEG